MWAANQLADLLARQAASTVRLSALTRRRVARQFRQARDFVIFVGKVTAAAGDTVMN